MQLKYADVCKSTKKSGNSNQNLTHSICLQKKLMVSVKIV